MSNISAFSYLFTHPTHRGLKIIFSTNCLIRWRLNWVSMFVTDFACWLAAVKPLFPLQKIHSKDCLFWEQVGFFPPIWECFDSEKLRVAQLASQRWIEELKHQKYLSIKCVHEADRDKEWERSFLPILVRCCLTAYLAGVLDWNNTTLQMSVSATSRQHPEPMKRRVQQLNSQSTGSLGGELGHQTIFLSHFLCMCLSYYFIFSLWIPSGQQNSDRNVVLAANDRHSQILSYYLSLNC